MVVGEDVSVKLPVVPREVRFGWSRKVVVDRMDQRSKWSKNSGLSGNSHVNGIGLKLESNL